MTIADIVQPLCIRCGRFPQSSRRAVLKGQCCNKCPNHGPWCTSREGEAVQKTSVITKFAKSPSKSPKCCRQKKIEKIQVVSFIRFGAGSDSRFEFVCKGVRASRPYMEDRFCACLNLPGHENCALFGIFDGHGGAEVAEFVARELPPTLGACMASNCDPADAFISAFQQVDMALWVSKEANGGEHPYAWIGTTAVVVLIVEEAGRRLLFCANCGDSRAVLSRNGMVAYLSEDHKPNNPRERMRIEDAGGSVSRLGPCYRINAGLNLSRSFGDFAYKSRPDLTVSRQMVTCVPEIRTFILEASDEFMMIGSDGVFDVMSSETLVKHTRDVLKHNDNLDLALQSALVRTVNGKDNATLCLVRLLK